jgi:transposase
MLAMVQVRRPSAGQAYYQHKLAEGKSAKEALRCLKPRLSDAVYRCLVTDQAEQAPNDGHQQLRAFSVRHRWIPPAASRP